MALQIFRRSKFSEEDQQKIEKVNEIISEYDSKLTARQLYYRFVAADLIPNTEKSYKSFTSFLTRARYAGEVDWEAIEDRGREPTLPLEFDSISHRVESALANYRLPRWKNQPVCAELWVEKQAMAGILAPLAREFHVTLLVNKGYSSASAMYEAAQRMREASGITGNWYEDWAERCNDELEDMEKESDEYEERKKAYVEEFAANCKETYLFYLGDHDPSGEDMVRDIEERLKEFGVKRLTVKKLALTMEQIRKHKPPPNPAKITDPRAKGYIEKHGNESWELDALPPRVLNDLIRTNFRAIIDQELMNKIIAQENEDKTRLRDALKQLLKEEEE